MLKYKTKEQQIDELRAENAYLKAEAIRSKANLDYISMMSDIELPEESEENDNVQPEI